MERWQKFVHFDMCKNCEHYKTDESDDPCHECLNTPVRDYSHTPINFKLKEGSTNTQSNNIGNDN